MSFIINRTPFEDTLHVHYGSSASASVTLENTGAPETTITTGSHVCVIRVARRAQKKYSHYPSILCLHTDTEGNECFEYLNCAEVPVHFKDAHGLEDLGRNHLLVCNCQQGCSTQVSGHNYVRHIRGCYPRYGRTLGHEDQVLTCARQNELGERTGDWMICTWEGDK
ncbi:hypothetical protein EDD17DRAFT_785372 [Pisolithus thermaeus]|nr:hypothetical protein EV401DRAFT_292592 [Pisolithus croceorrhizus]KAI6160650.1 hypothetical protein EDD17DRAFT_785372 [Pisolithus thermaeus]